MKINEIENGNYKAIIHKTTNGYGNQCYRVRVLLMSGTHSEGDVLFLREYEKESTANRAAKRELKKFAV